MLKHDELMPLQADESTCPRIDLLSPHKVNLQLLSTIADELHDPFWAASLRLYVSHDYHQLVIPSWLNSQGVR